jgi:hypothetical protein
MAVDDDIDSLEAELEGLDDDDDGRRSKFMRFLPVILAVGALIVFSVVVIVAYSGDDEEVVVMNIQDIGPETPTIKIEAESAGAPVPVEGQDNTAYNPMNQGSDDTQVAAITPPPEEPVTLAKPDIIKIPPPDAPKAPNADGKADMSGEAPQPVEPAATAGDKTDGEDAAMPENLIADTSTPTAVQPAQSSEQEPPATPSAEAPKSPKAPEAPTQTAQAAKVVQQQPVQKPKTPPQLAAGAGTTAFRTMAGVYRVQIASTKSEGLAQREWTDQVKKYPDVLSKLSLTVQRAVVKNRGVFYRVQGGPFADRNAADSVCRALKSRGQDCLVVRP